MAHLEVPAPGAVPSCAVSPEQAGQEALVFRSSSQAQRPLPLQILVATHARSQRVPLAHRL